MRSERTRWPSSVYGVGDDPDPRWSLANERTLLAWVRTGLGFLAASAFAGSLDLSLPSKVIAPLELLFALAGAGCAARAWRGWAAGERAMRLGRPLPGPGAWGTIGLVVVAAGLVLASASLVNL